jgi:hypothetical protein
MKQGRRVSWEEFRKVVLVLELDERMWKQRWEQAERIPRSATKSKLSPASARNPTAPRHLGDAGMTTVTPAQSNTYRRQLPRWVRRPPWIVLVLALFPVGAAVLGGGVMMSREPAGHPATPARHSPVAVDVACAVVTTSTANIFRAPGVGELRGVKYRGDRVVLHRDVDDEDGPDAHRYRAVRTPTRTASGYAWMRADALMETPC